MTPPGSSHDKQSQRALIDTLTAAIARHQRIDSHQARRLCLSVLDSADQKFAALHYFGVLEAQRGGYDEADCLIGQALAVDPRSAEACLNHGNVLNALARHAEALASLERALAIRPDYPEALNSRGAVLLDLGRPEEAVASLNRAQALRPGYPEALNNRGNALRALRHHEDAIQDYDRAIDIRPDYAEAFMNRGTALLELKQPERGLESYDRALALSPGHADALLGRGTALRDLGRYREAVESYDRALTAAPGLAEARCNRGAVLQELGRYEEAAGDYQRLVALQPDYDYALGHLLHVRQHCCDWTQFEESAARVATLVRDGKRAALPFEFLPVSDSASDYLRCARTFVADKYPAPAAAALRGGKFRHDRIRVAYLSADFHIHAMTRLMAGVFEAHDKARFEITAISFGPDSTDEMRTRVEAAIERFVDVRGKSASEAAALMRDLEIDIAVDLAGHTANARTDILAHRGAPIQVNYLGYPGSLGADYIDYIIADRIVIPAEHHPDYIEKVVYLPDAYQANDSKRPLPEGVPTRAEAGLPETGFVYCSFNNNYKITPGIFDSWMRILRRVQGSVLWLVEDNGAAARNLRREAARRDVAPERLLFAPRVKFEEHLARQRLADLFLDTLPYNAHTTASDALWTGLPVLTCLGTTFAGRVGASLLTAAGMPELITRDLQEYEALAVRLAEDRPRLGELAGKLALNRATCPLFDTDRTRRHIEAAYRIMWERHQDGAPPEAFSVPAIP
jgi:predicted O-linked N-acetylglucosamine transferase (SPINDLY family)